MLQRLSIYSDMCVVIRTMEIGKNCVRNAVCRHLQRRIYHTILTFPMAIFRAGEMWSSAALRLRNDSNRSGRRRAPVKLVQFVCGVPKFACGAAVKVEAACDLH